MSRGESSFPLSILLPVFMPGSPFPAFFYLVEIQPTFPQPTLFHNTSSPNPIEKERVMKKSLKWTKPAFKEMRYGFEINLYIMNR